MILIISCQDTTVSSTGKLDQETGVSAVSQVYEVIIDLLVNGNSHMTSITFTKQTSTDFITSEPEWKIPCTLDYLLLLLFLYLILLVKKYEVCVSLHNTNARMNERILFSKGNKSGTKSLLTFGPSNLASFIQ